LFIGENVKWPSISCFNGKKDSCFDLKVLKKKRGFTEHVTWALAFGYERKGYLLV
jgi:hypothetical protein